MPTTKLELIKAKVAEGTQLLDSDVQFLIRRCCILSESISLHQDRCIKEYGEVILPMDRKLYESLDEDYDPESIAKQTRKKRS